MSQRATCTRRFPSRSARWNCSSASYQDLAAVGGPIRVTPRLGEHVAHALHDRWLLLVGDSSVRMLFELLVGVVALNWKKWPAHLDNHGMMDSRVLTPSKFLCKTPIRHGNWSCLRDMYVNGTRITYLWLDTAEDDQWRALDALERSSLAAPSAILASFGAWDTFLAGQRPDVKGYRYRVGRTLSRLDAMFEPNASFFGPLWPRSPKKLFAALSPHLRLARPTAAVSQRPAPQPDCRGRRV